MHKKLLVIFIFILEILIASNVFGAAWQPEPTLNISITPTSVTRYTIGGDIEMLSVYINYSTTNATSCTASGGWSGPKDTLGYYNYVYPTTTTTYNLSCTGPGGTVSDSVTVSVTNVTIPLGQSCLVSADTNYQWVLQGENSQIVGSYGSTSCSWTGGICNASNVGHTGTWGEYSGPPNGIMYSTKWYTCVYNPPSPTVSLTANGASSATITTTQTASLSWSGTNSTSCYGVSSKTSSTPTTLSDTVPYSNLTPGVYYPITETCNGPGGISHAYVAVTVTAAPIPIDGSWSAWTPTQSTQCGYTGTQTRICTPPQNGGTPCSAIDGGNSSRTYTTAACPPMSGTLSCSSCVITSGNSSCNANISWSTTNPQGTSAITSSYPSANTIIATGNSGSQSVIIPYDSRSLLLYNNSNELNSCLISTACVSGTSWDGTKCAPIVNGGWSAWSSWSACRTTSCGQTSTQTSTRTCTNPSPSGGGADCSSLDGGNSSKTQSCSSAACPIDGYWGDWSGCSASCGGGTQTRSCVGPFYGGAACSGVSSQSCNTQTCVCEPPLTKTVTGIACDSIPGYSVTGSVTRNQVKSPPTACAFPLPPITVSNSSYVSDTCVYTPLTCTAPTSETQTLSCPAGYSGSITQTRTKSAYPDCTFGSWTTTSNTCTLNPVMSGTLSVPSCTISSGANSCNVTISWSTSNPEGVSAVTSSYPSFNTIVATGNSGSHLVAIPFDSRDFYLYNNNNNLDSGMAYADCASGTSWSSGQNKCITVSPPSPTADISASPSSVASGESVTITWSSANTNSCIGTGFSTGGATSGTITVSPTSNTTYGLSCDNGTVVATNSTSVTINTTGTKKKPIFKEN